VKNLLKLILSLFAIYHLCAITIFANPSSFLGRHLSEPFLYYANMFGLNNTWNFFSPDPAHTMYLSYRVHFEDTGATTKEPIEGFLPPEKKQIVVNSSRRRMLYALRFLLLDPSRFQTILEPWLCRQFPGASEIALSYNLETLPSLDLALSHPDLGIEQMKSLAESNAENFRCNFSESSEN